MKVEQKISKMEQKRPFCLLEKRPVEEALMNNTLLKKTTKLDTENGPHQLQNRQTTMLVKCDKCPESRGTIWNLQVISVKVL